MKSFSQTMIVERAKGNILTFLLARMSADFRWTDCPKGLFYNGEAYSYAALRISGFRSADGTPLDGGTVTVGNADNEAGSIILNSLLDGASPRIYEAWLNPDMSLIGVDLIGAGKVQGRGECDEESATWTVSSYLNLSSKRFPPRIITRSLFPYMPARGRKFTWGSTIIEVK